MYVEHTKIKEIVENKKSNGTEEIDAYCARCTGSGTFTEKRTRK